MRNAEAMAAKATFPLTCLKDDPGDKFISKNQSAKKQSITMIRPTKEQILKQRKTLLQLN